MTRSHAFERYRRQRGHYPRFRRGGLTVSVLPSYIIVHKKTRDTYIPRDTLIPLLKWLVPLARRMEGSFDPDEAITEYLIREEEFRQELKQQKRQAQRLRR